MPVRVRSYKRFLPRSAVTRAGYSRMSFRNHRVLPPMCTGGGSSLRATSLQTVRPAQPSMPATSGSGSRSSSSPTTSTGTGSVFPCLPHGLRSKDQFKGLRHQAHAVATVFSCGLEFWVFKELVEEDDPLAHHRHQRHLGGSARRHRPPVEHLETRVGKCGRQRRHVQRPPRGGTPSANKSMTPTQGPLSRLSGATPTNAAACRRFNVPNSGGVAKSTTAVMSPTPTTRHNRAILLASEGSAWTSSVIQVCSCSNCRSRQTRCRCSWRRTAGCVMCSHRLCSAMRTLLHLLAARDQVG